MGDPREVLEGPGVGCSRFLEPTCFGLELLFQVGNLATGSSRPKNAACLPRVHGRWVFIP